MNLHRLLLAIHHGLIRLSLRAVRVGVRKGVIRPSVGRSLISVNHAPHHFQRRNGHFTANICGIFDPRVSYARYMLNDLEWRTVGHTIPRVPHPLFTLELESREITAGGNRVIIEAFTDDGETATEYIHFTYDPSPIRLPIKVGWNRSGLDVQDGHWEKVSRLGRTYVRPKPNALNYDRILVVAGCFAGGRRVEVECIYISRSPTSSSFGFGVLPMWGGRPDRLGSTPREGWNFSLAWYYSHYAGVGSEFSYKFSNESPKWVANYRNFDLRPGDLYRVIVEVWPVHAADGHHLRYDQRVRWESDTHPASYWMSLQDNVDCALPQGEYSVALIAHHCLVEFGAVSITGLPPVQLEKRGTSSDGLG